MVAPLTFKSQKRTSKFRHSKLTDEEKSNRKTDLLNWKDNVSIPGKQDRSGRPKKRAIDTHTHLAFDEIEEKMVESITKR